ncbi:MAG: ABC transporter substrate-binding protein [Lachnospiraceae bacterium]|nr:ABC transporter substrate-binding protein [Lachnospiraceae bacterium]
MAAALCAACVLSFTYPMPVRAEEEEPVSEIGVHEEADPPEIPGLTFEKKTDFVYAQAVDIFYYEGGYKFFDIYESGQYLLVPEGAQVPEGLDGSVKVIKAPLDNIYMAATASMALVSGIGGLDKVGFSSVTADNWYVQEAQDAMNAGDILFAGKYSEPDFEMLLSQGCDLAVESTMILHSPKVQEMIEKLGIPVFIDRSSYESHPMGRSEWVKVYGALLDMEEEADAFFTEQSAVMDELDDFENTGKTVAFFSLHTNGTVVVRRTEDYVPKMIELAGGVYVMDGIEALQTAKRSSVNITMEEFYSAAVNADYIVYNGTIEVPIHSIDELLAKDPLFGQFKAVQEGNVWCADKYLYQATDITGELIRDFHHMLTDGDESRMTFIYKCE